MKLSETLHQRLAPLLVSVTAALMTGYHLVHYWSPELRSNALFAILFVLSLALIALSLLLKNLGRRDKG